MRLIKDANVPQYPAYVVERQGHEQVLVHLDPTAVQALEVEEYEEGQDEGD